MFLANYIINDALVCNGRKGIKSAELLQILFENNFQIKKLLLSDCYRGLTPETITNRLNEVFYGVKLGRFANLVELDLSHNHIQKNLEILYNNSIENCFANLQILNLSNNFIGDKGALYLANIIIKSSMTQLRSLNLAINFIYDSGIIAISTLFNVNIFDHLEYLNIEGNFIKNDGVIYLADRMNDYASEKFNNKQMVFLRDLILNFNQFDNVAFKYLLQKIKNRPQNFIEFISFNDLQKEYKNECVKSYLSYIVEKEPKLNMLFLDVENFSTDIFKLFKETINKVCSYSLQKITLIIEHKPKYVISYLAQAILKNKLPNLEEINLKIRDLDHDLADKFTEAIVCADLTYLTSFLLEYSLPNSEIKLGGNYEYSIQNLINITSKEI